MASSLALRLVIDDDGGMYVALTTTHGGTLECARLGYLREPYGARQACGAAGALIGVWLAPELAQDGLQALEATFDSLTTPF